MDCWNEVKIFQGPLVLDRRSLEVHRWAVRRMKKRRRAPWVYPMWICGFGGLHKTWGMISWWAIQGSFTRKEARYHSEYWSFQRAFQPSGTFGGGGPPGGAKSAMDWFRFRLYSWLWDGRRVIRFGFREDGSEDNLYLYLYLFLFLLFEINDTSLSGWKKLEGQEEGNAKWGSGSYVLSESAKEALTT